MDINTRTQQTKQQKRLVIYIIVVDVNVFKKYY